MVQKPNTAEPSKPRRRWFQFRLRTLLIGVVPIGTACGYLAHEAAIVAERKRWLETHELLPFSGSHYNEPVTKGDPGKSPRLVRRWLGDRSPAVIEIRRDIPRKDLDDAARLFPESNFYSDGFRK